MRVLLMTRVTSLQINAHRVECVPLNLAGIGADQQNGRMDIEAVVDELYRLPPDKFTGRRDELAAQAKEGRRRPTSPSRSRRCVVRPPRPR